MNRWVLYSSKLPATTPFGGILVDMSKHDETAFLLAYNRLNAKQREAVDTIEGPVMVVAGPGTGKTQILTLRIANILRQTQMQPENILALTFTKSGAKAMRERLRTFVGSLAYRVPIFTFHGLAERLIRDYPEAYTKIIGGKPVTEIERIEIIESILEHPDLGVLRPAGAPEFYVRPLLSIIGTMKQENVGPDELSRLILNIEEELRHMPRYHEKGAHKGKERGEYTKLVGQVEKQRALQLVYRLYEAAMRERARYDFDDMILETVRVLKENESVRLDLQETYQYILADEHQDVNGAQNEILVQLTSYHDNPNLFVVGDEKQAIYRFQGASLENFLYFESLFPQTKVIVLTDNYRSTQPILDVSQSLIAVADGPLADYRIPLTGHREASTDIAVTEYGSEQQEHVVLTERIKCLLAEGVSPEEVAVIVRSNREVEMIAELLESHGVPVEATADSDILEDPLFLSLIDLLEVILHPHDMTVFTRVFEAPYWGIAPRDMFTVLLGVTYDISLVARLGDREWLTMQGVGDVSAVMRVLQVIIEARQDMTVLPPHRLIARLLESTHFLTFATKRHPVTAARVIRRFYDEVEGLVRNGEAKQLNDVVALLRRRMVHRVPLSAPFVDTRVSAVQVMTAHKSKGLEYTAVFIPHLTDATWGSGGRPQYFKIPLMRTAALELEANEDERRLLYVALTRAKEKLYVSYAAQSADGKVLSPSPLLDTMMTLAPVTVGEPVSLPDLLPRTMPKTAEFEAVRELLQRTLAEKGLSATSLNNGIKNPWNYLYRNVIHLPEVQSLPLLFGTAMHGVFEAMTRAKTKTGVMPTFSEQVSYLERELGKLPLGTVEFTDLLKRGHEVLVTYVPHMEQTLGATTKEELSVRVVFETNHPLCPTIPLTGKLDRIDLDTDGRAFRVVDYKTGKPKTRNEIEGKTAKADASYRRQLSFYSLLLSLHDDDRYRTETGVLSFIEADSKGRIHEEEYESGEAERALLRDEINLLVEQLISGDFLTDEVLLEASDYASIGRNLLEGLS